MDNQNNINKTQLILFVILSSVVVSITTTVIVIALIGENPPHITNVINRVARETIGIPATTTEKKTENENSQIVAPKEYSVEKIIELTNNAVISIIASKDIPIIEQYFVNPFNDQFKGVFPQELVPDIQIPQYRQKGTEKKQISNGSGFFISEDGLILTNKHVVEDIDAEYTVITNNGKKLQAKVLARDKTQDIAILKVNASKHNFIPLGDSDSLKVGQSVIAIGNALGEFQNTVSTGVISGLKRNITAFGAKSGPEDLQSLIQTDAAINPGNSGGPLLNSFGHVIGINTALAQGAQSIGFALPINLAKKDISDIKKFNKIINPFFGVRYAIITPEIKQKNNLNVDYGAIISKGSNNEEAVYPNSPANKAGIKENDIILEFDNEKINQSNPLFKLIAKKNIGDKIQVKILRDGKEINILVTLEEAPANI